LTLRRIDLHRHLWPAELAAALAARQAAPYLRGGRLTTSEGTFDIDLEAHGIARCLDQLDASGFTTAVVSLQPTLGIERLPTAEAAELFTVYNDGIARVAADAAGRIRALAAGAPRAGFAGVCVPAAALLDPARVEILAEELTARSQILFVHPGPGDPPAGAPDWWAPGIDYTAQMQAAYGAWLAHGVERWPQLPVVFAILAGGAPFQIERLQSRGVDTRRATGAANVYFDTASYGRLALELCLATFGVTRLVYGSDAPVLDPAVSLSTINALGKVTSDAILRNNAAALVAA
jgi:predicted TIM-barrel fold metal-dependent hydrolase